MAITSTSYDFGLDDPETVVVHPNGHWAYFADDNSTVSAANIAKDGTMTLLNSVTSDYDAEQGDNNNGLTVTPDGKFLYRADESSTVTGFSIDQSTGHITALGATTVNANASTEGIFAVKNASDNNQYLYVAGTNALYAYKINSDGSLTFVNSVTTQFDFYTVIADPSGKYVYACSGWDGENGLIMQYTVGTGGALAANSTAASITAAGNGPEILSFAVSSDGKFLYATDMNAGPHAFSIGSNGTLTELTGSPYAIAQNVSSAIAIDPNGKFAVVADGNIDDSTGYLYAYQINSNGTLTNLTGTSTITTPQKYPSYVAFASF
jgi:6-phosphogluconolactonase (cycloisomerase 2 family)